MKKENIYKILYIISILLIICFGLIIIFDYINYNKNNNSAPFYAFIIIRGIEFIVPSIMSVVILKLIKKK